MKSKILLVMPQPFQNLSSFVWLSKELQDRTDQAGLTFSTWVQCPWQNKGFLSHKSKSAFRWFDRQFFSGELQCSLDCWLNVDGRISIHIFWACMYNTHLASSLIFLSLALNTDLKGKRSSPSVDVMFKPDSIRSLQISSSFSSYALRSMWPIWQALCWKALTRNSRSAVLSWLDIWLKVRTWLKGAALLHILISIGPARSNAWLLVGSQELTLTIFRAICFSLACFATPRRMKPPVNMGKPVFQCSQPIWI